MAARWSSENVVVEFRDAQVGGAAAAAGGLPRRAARAAPSRAGPAVPVRSGRGAGLGGLAGPLAGCGRGRAGGGAVCAVLMP